MAVISNRGSKMSKQRVEALEPTENPAQAERPVPSNGNKGRLARLFGFGLALLSVGLILRSLKQRSQPSSGDPSFASVYEAWSKRHRRRPAGAEPPWQTGPEFVYDAQGRSYLDVTDSVAAARLPELDLSKFHPLQGMKVVDVNGADLGTVKGVYYRPLVGEPEWLELEMGPAGVLVPIEGMTVGDEIVVPYTKDQIETAPSLLEVLDEQWLDEAWEMRLFEHYSLRRVLPGLEAAKSDENTALRRFVPVA
jgi:hypothetical protein